MKIEQKNYIQKFITLTYQIHLSFIILNLYLNYVSFYNFLRNIFHGVRFSYVQISYLIHILIFRFKKILSFVAFIKFI